MMAMSTSDDIVVYPDPTWSILEVKQHLEIVVGTPAELQRLYVHNAALLDHEVVPANTVVGLTWRNDGTRPCGRRKVTIKE